jgi:glycosyltransferase involved in cell wall biosynthesis
VRVLYLNPFSQEVSGPDESLLTLLGALIPMGVEAHLVLPRPGPHVPRYQALGVTVHHAPLSVLRRKLGAGALLYPFRLLRGAAAVARIARRERVDLIHTNMEVVLDGALASRLFRIPHVLHYRGNTKDEPKVVFDVLARIWASTSARVIAISRSTAEIFHKRGLARAVLPVYDPIDLDAFRGAIRSDDVRRELGAGPADLLIGTVARLHPRKGIATFVRAAAEIAPRVPHARFAVIGSAHDQVERAHELELRRLVDALRLGGVVRFAGARSDIPAVMRSLDLLVLASRTEGFGRVVPEAMAAGVPCVLSREGALPEIAVEDREALFFDPADPSSLGRSLGRLAGDPDLRSRISSTARQGSQRYGVETSARSVLEVYRAALRRAPARRP